MCSADARSCRLLPRAAAVLGWCLAASVPAHAQPAVVPTTQPAVAAHDSPALSEARERVTRGEYLFARGDFRAAITEYERAYALVPGHPVQHHALFNIATCHEKLFQHAAALAHYQRYLREGGPGAERREQVEARIASLQDRLATLHVVTSVHAQVWVDGSLVGEAPGAVLVSGGRHAVVVRAAGHEAAMFEVRLAAGQQQRRSVALRALSDVHGAAPTWFWASTAAAGAALATGIVLGALAVNESSALHARTEHPVEKLVTGPEDGEAMQDLALGADIAFGTALVFSATSLVLYFVTDWNGEPAREPPRGSSGLRAAPRAGPGSVGVTLRGTL